MNTEIPKDYNQHAIAMTNRERKACAERAGALFTKAQHAAMNIGELEVVCLNRLREAGIQFNIACGREQLIFTVEGREFCRKELLPHLPPEMDIAAIQACVHIANNVPKPIETREELKAVKAELQLAFQALGLADAPRRKELQTAHARNLFSDFVNKFAAVKLTLDELETEQPMDKWPSAKLDEFIENAQPVKAKIERAEKLRLGFN